MGHADRCRKPLDYMDNHGGVAGPVSGPISGSILGYLAIHAWDKTDPHVCDEIQES